MSRMGGTGMGGGSNPEMMLQRALEVINIFKERGALSVESAKTLGELDLLSYFPRILQNRLGSLGVIVEKDGYFYLVEGNIEKL